MQVETVLTKKSRETNSSREIQRPFLPSLTSQTVAKMFFDMKPLLQGEEKKSNGTQMRSTLKPNKQSKLTATIMDHS